MPQVDLQGLGVAGLPKPLYGVAVSQQVRIDPFRNPRSFRRGFQNLPGPLAVDRKEAVVQAQAPVKGVALEAVRQDVRTGYQAGLFALAFCSSWPWNNEFS